MPSPFSSYQEFYEAEGPIYTFANNPTIIGILIIVSALTFIYFLYASYAIKKGHSAAKSPIVLSVLLLASAVSLADAVYTNHLNQSDRTVSQHPPDATVHTARSGSTRRVQPLALLGLFGSGAALSGGQTIFRRKGSTARRKQSAIRRRPRR